MITRTGNNARRTHTRRSMAVILAATTAGFGLHAIDGGHAIAWNGGAAPGLSADLAASQRFMAMEHQLVTTALAQAPVEVVGTPGGHTVVAVPHSHAVMTLTQVRVNSIVRGAVTTRSILVQTKGGRLSNGHAQVVTDEPTLRQGVTTTLYLTQQSNGRFDVVAGPAGAVPVAGAPVTTPVCDTGDIPGNDYCLEPYHYATADLPVPFSINTAGGPAGSQQVIEQSFNTWTAVSGMRWAETSAATANPVSFGTLPAGVLGQTTTTFTGTHLESFTMVLTNNLQGHVLSTVATHEAGHALGMGHINNDATQVMSPNVAVGVVKSLGTGDIAGVQSMYGPSGAPAAAPTAVAMAAPVPAVVTGPPTLSPLPTATAMPMAATPPPPAVLVPAPVLTPVATAPPVAAGGVTQLAILIAQLLQLVVSFFQ